MLKEKIKIRSQYLLPKHLLTRLIGWLAAAKLGRFTTFIISKFASFYNINLKEMQGKITDYPTFNDFFSRPLKPNARSLDPLIDSIVFPCDGRIGQYGDLIKDCQLQAKGHYFSIATLLADETEAADFHDGKFITVYLSPQDYHRVHMPYSGKLQKMIYVPGELFSVNPLYVRNIPELFARNERVVCLFETDLGKMAVVLVGAAIVRSIFTEWAGIVAPCKSSKIVEYDYTNQNFSYKKGAEIARFMMGSTVICLFEKNKADFIKDLAPEIKVKVGQKMAQALIMKDLNPQPARRRGKTATAAPTNTETEKIKRTTIAKTAVKKKTTPTSRKSRKASTQ